MFKDGILKVAFSDLLKWGCPLIRFRKTVRVIPGVKLNLSGGGASVSVGGRGGTINVGKRGVTSTVGIPGTGLSWSKRSGWSANGSVTNAQVISGMMKQASKTLGQVERAAGKGNAIVARLNKAINTLGGGRGISSSKLETFGRRVSDEEQKMVALEDTLEEALALFDAMVSRLKGMTFGLFARADKKRRDAAVQAISNAGVETRKVLGDFGRLAEAIADKVTEIETASQSSNSV